MERILDNLRPSEAGKTKRVRYSFTTVKLNPFEDRYQSNLSLIPRVVIAPD